MSNYMLLLYAPDPADAAEQAEREADMPTWMGLISEWEQDGSFVATGRLHPIATATTVRAPSGEAELTDGPFATTKEMLGGYFILACDDLDDALRRAARLPVARYGAVEVRPIMADPRGEAPPARDGASAAA